jgi:hypothetical protein
MKRHGKRFRTSSLSYVSRDGVIGLVIRLQTGRLRNRRSILGRTVARNESLIQSAQTSYGAQSAFRSLGTGGYFLGGIKRSGVSSPFATKIKNEWSSTSTPTYAFMTCTCTTLSLPRYRNTLTDATSPDRPSKTALSISWLGAAVE